MVAAECKPHPGVRVQQVSDLLIPEHVVPSSIGDGTLIHGTRVGAYSIPGFTLPAHLIDGGCVIYHDAPGGCLGAVDITAAAIPPVRIPGFTLPGAHYGSTKVAGATVAGASAPGAVAPGQHQAQVCRQKQPKDSQFVASVFRPSVFRPSASRSSLSRPSASRDSFTAGGVYVNSAYINSVYVNSAYLNAVYVTAGYLNARYLPHSEHTTVVKGRDQTSYTTSADVLFDFDKAILKPTARTALLAVAAELRKHGGSAPIRVDGFTDSIASRSYNLRLSVKRAEAVRACLVSAGHIAAGRMSVKGYGEADPVAPNTRPGGADNPSGRAQNRRVVITVLTTSGR